MKNAENPVKAALLSGSRSKGYARQIDKICRDLPSDTTNIDDNKRRAILKLATACRATRAVQTVLRGNDGLDIPAIDQMLEFDDLFCKAYYPVLEDGKRSVSFWSIRDSAVLSPADVHEWVRDVVVDKKTGARKVVPTPFGNYWVKHKPDYDLYAVAADRSQWNKKIITIDGRPAVNTAYGKPPVLTTAPEGYDHGKATAILKAILERTICDDSEDVAIQKRKAFVLDAGAHMLALRDFGEFRCRKIFCFASTNQGQGSGKSILHESLASLVPVGASCTVPTTTLAGTNLLPLYSSSVCVLTEAPSTANERYTSEDVKAFADAGWKTAEEKYVAKRPVFDNSLKLLSSNHLSPLPVDSQYSRRMEFFVSAENDDGGRSLRLLLEEVQVQTGWDSEKLRQCIGWSIMLTAQVMLDAGAIPQATARRAIDAKHILTQADYDYFVVECASNPELAVYGDYKDWRNKRGFTWYVDSYRFKTILKMSESRDSWLDPPVFESDDDPDTPEGGGRDVRDAQDSDCGTETSVDTPKPNDARNTLKTAVVASPTASELKNGFTGSIQYKSKVAKLRLEPEQLTPYNVVELVASDWLKGVTEEFRAGRVDGNQVLPQIFPSAYFDRFTRGANIAGYTGLVHVDFDDITRHDTLSVEECCAALSEIDGFVMSASSPSGNGVWAIYNAGDKVVDRATFVSATDAVTSLCEEALCMPADTGMRIPTMGRRLGYDGGCCYAEEIVDGGLPPPFKWRQSRYATAAVGRHLLNADRQAEMSIEERARQERFIEAVVENSCAKIVASGDGERHNTAITAIANIVLNCQERGVLPLATWGRKVREACQTCGLPTMEINGIMSYWRQMSGTGG